MKKPSTRPKRQQPSNNKLKDPQQYQKFVSECMDVCQLIDHGKDGTVDSKLWGEGKYGILSHLAYLSFGKPQQQAKEEGQLQTDTHRTNNETRLIPEDQDSEYLNYLKQYETVVKNSRRKEYVSVQPKQQMDQLISQFLSDINDSNGKTSRCSQTQQNSKYIQNVTVQPQIPVKVQKIDLNMIKNHGNSRVNNKYDTKQSTTAKKKDEETPIKHIEINLKDRQIELSPRFGSTQEKKESKSPRMNYKTKNGEKVQITVLKTDKCQQKKEPKQIKTVKQTKPQHNKSNIKPKNRQEPKSQTKNDSYANHRSHEISSQSYLKQNIHKTSRHNVRPQLRQIVPCERSETNSIDKRKPIKIEIDIPIEQFSQSEIERVQNYEVESTVGLEGEQTKIIREVTERVLSLLHKTKQVGKHARH